jgi:hypothetical protein
LSDSHLFFPAAISKEQQYKKQHHANGDSRICDIENVKLEACLGQTKTASACLPATFQRTFE